MVEISLASGETLRMPLVVDDISASRWFGFSSHERELERLGAEIEPGGFMAGISAAVSCAVDAPEGFSFEGGMPFGLPAKSIAKKVWSLEPECFVSFGASGAKEKQVTVLNIYRHLLWVQRTFQPTEFPLFFKGRDWNLTPNLKNIAYEGEFTAQESVEVMKIEENFEAQISLARKGEAFDFAQIASADFGLSMCQVALLLRPVDESGKIEPLPFGESAIERYIGERASELEGLPYSVILTTRFFFQSTLNNVCAWETAKETLRARLNTPLSG